MRERPSWTITYGAGVIPDLVDGIRAHADTAARNHSQKFWPATAAVGCVPFFTSTTVADALLRLDAYCVVVDKQAQRSPALACLAGRQGDGLSSRYLYELDGLTPPKRARLGSDRRPIFAVAGSG
jgi:hypothetical protein